MISRIPSPPPGPAWRRVVLYIFTFLLEFDGQVVVIVHFVHAAGDRAENQVRDGGDRAVHGEHPLEQQGHRVEIDRVDAQAEQRAADDADRQSPAVYHDRDDQRKKDREDEMNHQTDDQGRGVRVHQHILTEHQRTHIAQRQHRLGVEHHGCQHEQRHQMGNSSGKAREWDRAPCHISLDRFHEHYPSA